MKSLNHKLDRLNIWFDNCGGQNKSSFNVGFMSFLLEQENIDTVSFKYLEVGHTFNNCDQGAGVAERKIAQFERIETPECLYKIIE